MTMKINPDQTIEEALLPPSSSSDEMKQERMVQQETPPSPPPLTSALHQDQSEDDEKNQDSRRTPSLLMRKMTMDQIQDNHLLDVPTKRKDMRVGTLFDGWKPYDPKADKFNWYLRECLNGLTTSFSQIPECIYFSKLAHVNPTIGLRSTWIVGIICAVIGGRPAMINGSSGAYAMMIATYMGTVNSNGEGEDIEYLFPSVVFAGILNMIFSFLNIGDGLLTLLSSTIVIAFCNSLAFFMANPLFGYEFPVSRCDLYGLISSNGDVRYRPKIFYIYRTKPTKYKYFGLYSWPLFA